MIKFVFNENYKSGMFTSLQAGLTNTNTNWYLYHFVDQPSLPLNFYSDFANQIDDQSNWIQPTYQNRKGHPILFDNYVKEMILKEVNTIHCVIYRWIRLSKRNFGNVILS
ncbi:MAG: NTP transferase domain-containing protein [Melioribacteraceae bacterium]|nr:NTP transferase domain-containing protein [Melioribacteraceae bacterium]